MITIFNFLKKEKTINYKEYTFTEFCKDCDMKSHFGDAWRCGSFVVRNNIIVWNSGTWNL